MSKYNIGKLVAVIMVIELVMVNVGAKATHNNGDSGNKISLGCIASCVVICIRSEELFPICMAACLLGNCSNNPSSHSPAVKRCTTACAQSTCSIGSGNFLFVMDFKDFSIYIYLNQAEI